MPRNAFYNPTVVEGDLFTIAEGDCFEVVWPGEDAEEAIVNVDTIVKVAGVEMDHSGVNRLIKSLRRAQRKNRRFPREED